MPPFGRIMVKIIQYWRGTFLVQHPLLLMAHFNGKKGALYKLKYGTFMLKKLPLGAIVLLLFLPPLPHLLLCVLLLLPASLDRRLLSGSRFLLHGHCLLGRGQRWGLFGRLLGRGLFLWLKMAGCKSSFSLKAKDLLSIKKWGILGQDLLSIKWSQNIQATLSNNHR